MPIPLVWSERIDNSPDGRLYDCTEASALMVLVAGGFTRFPLGIYTPEERNALDAASTRPPNTGDMLPDIDGAVKRRYGVTLRKLTVTTTAALTTELSKPGRAYLLTGQFSHFPEGHTLRRWQPKFTAGHAVCVIPRQEGTVLWLDPLAPNRFPGDLIPASMAAQFAWQNWEGRYVGLGELSILPDAAMEQNMVDPNTTWPVASVEFRGGTMYHNARRSDGAYKPLQGRTRLFVFALPRNPTEKDGKASLVPVLAQFGPDDYRVVGVGIDQMDAETWEPYGWQPDTVDCAQAVKEAVDPLRTRIDRMKALTANHNAQIQTA